MKKTSLLFIILCIAVCFVPLFGMMIRPTTETTENRNLSVFPAVKTEEGSLNRDFFKQFETWFHEHFAFRNELVYADAQIQGKVFGVSAEDSVIYGKNNWLYYTSSLGDFIGTNRFTEREQYALQHNLALAAQFARNRGIPLALAVPPSKNTLYGENMPYYDSLIVDSVHNVDVLPEKMAKEEIPYADLTKMFRDEEEVLYLERDSHWNNKGAMMAYRRIMEVLGHEFDPYENIEPVREKTEDGDLNRMLYSFYGEKEYNYRYDIPQEYQVTNGAQSVEDIRYETYCPTKIGLLLMFRDSFANTLIPMIANQFGYCWFTKEGQYRLEKLVEENNPNYIIIEKGERGLRDLITLPPVISAPVKTVEILGSAEDAEAVLNAEAARIDVTYCLLSGTVSRSLLGPETDIAVSVNGVVYDAYLTGENSFAVYLKKDMISTFPARMQILTVEDGEATVVLEKTVDAIDESGLTKVR